MAWYSFSGRNPQGDIVEGRYQANTEAALELRLQAAGITVLSVRRLGFLQACCLNIKHFLSFFVPIRKTDLSLFYYQLADLLAVDISLKNALFLIANHVSNPRLARVIHQMIQHLAHGLSLADAMRKHSKLFSTVAINLIDFSRSKEELAGILRYCDQAIRRSYFIRRLLLLIMPQLSLMAVFFLVLLYLRKRYLSDFNYAIYVFRQSPPVVIDVFDTVTSLLSVHLMTTMATTIGVACCLKIVLSWSKKLRWLYHAGLCCLPIASGVVMALERERLSLLYSVLLRGGSNVQKCAKSAAAVVNNLHFRLRVEAMSLAIEQGSAFPSALRMYKIFNAAEVQMITLGTMSHSLAQAFDRIYSISQIILERKLQWLMEFIRFSLYMINTASFFFVIYVAETLFYYPGSGS